MQRPVIELGLVMAGGAAMNAFMAGAADCLIEAVAAYEAEKAKGDPGFPAHELTLQDGAHAPMPQRPLYAGAVKTVDFAGLVDDRALTGTSAAKEPERLAEESPDRLRVEILIAPEMPHPSPASEGLATLAFRLLQPLLPCDSQPQTVAARDLRFVIAPQRRDESGRVLPAALAGPLDIRFREHDYKLGRRNAQRFLARHFALPSHHPAVAGWSEAMDRDFGIWPKGVARTCPAPLRPIIPLTGAARAPCEAPAWPALEPKALRGIERTLRRRLDALTAELARDYLGAPAAFLFAPRRRQAVGEAVIRLRRLLEERGQIAARGKPRIAAAKQEDRPRLKLVPLTGKRKMLEPIQTAGWGHSIDGLEDADLVRISQMC